MSLTSRSLTCASRSPTSVGRERSSLSVLATCCGTVLALAMAACASAPEVASPLQAPAEPESLALHGIVRWADEPAQLPACGELHLVLSYPERTTIYTVEVSNGMWSTDVAPGVLEARLGRLALDGIEAYCEAVVPASAFGTPIELAARPTQRNVLRVRSRATGRELTADLELVASDAAVLPDTSTGLHAKGLGSPIVLPEFDEDGPLPERWYGHQTWWVRGPRYAWTPVDLDHAAGGERVVELELAGVLLVTPSGVESASDLELHLSRGPKRGLPRAGLAVGEPLAVEGLAAGLYRVALARGTGPEPVELCASLARVEAGQVAEIVLDASRPAPPPQPLHGSLRIPAEWGDVAHSIELSFLSNGFRKFGRPATVPKEPTLWSWDAGMQPPGRYLAFVRPFQWSFTFDYNPVMATDFELVIPPPAQVCVRLLDRVTKEPISDEDLSWYGMPPPQASSITPEPVPFNAQRGGFCFTAPVGDIVLCLADAEQPFRFETARVAAGSNTIEVACAPYVRVRVFAVLDGARVPWPEGAFLRAAEGDSATHFRRWFPRTDCAEVGFDAPGSYQLQLEQFGFDGIPNYEPTSLRVETARGGVAEFELTLKRKP